MKHILENLQEQLELRGVITVFSKADASNPFPKLTQAIALPDLNWNLEIELMLVSDLSLAQAGEEADKENDLEFLQFFVPLPFSVAEAQAADIARLVGLINNFVPLMGFAYNESGGLVYFRHLLIALDGHIDPETVEVSLDTIQYLIDTFGAALQDLASGARSLEKIVADDVTWK
jgi:hypothetical protein